MLTHSTSACRKILSKSNIVDNIFFKEGTIHQGLTLLSFQLRFLHLKAVSSIALNLVRLPNTLWKNGCSQIDHLVQISLAIPAMHLLVFGNPGQRLCF